MDNIGDHGTRTMRRPRADAVRNHERVLEAAKAVFSAGGPDASLEAVARRAGVGIGTLYRHFPTREALFEAVYRREVEQLVDLAEQLKVDVAPADALRRWLRSTVAFVATKKGRGKNLALAAHSPLPYLALFIRTPGPKRSERCSTGRSRPARYAPISAREI